MYILFKSTLTQVHLVLSLIFLGVEHVICTKEGFSAAAVVGSADVVNTTNISIEI